MPQLDCPPRAVHEAPHRSGKPRLAGVDVARGLALLGMMATHVFDSDGSPDAAELIAGGRAAATFALLAGVGLALLSGGREVVRGRVRTAVSAGLVVRAVLIGAIGLLLGFTDGADVILPFYALLYLLLIPLLALSPKKLAVGCAVVIALGPVLLVELARRGVEFGTADNPTPLTLLTDPVGLLVQLLVTGTYPVVVFLAYVGAGLAIGRLDLGSRRVAWWLLGGGAGLAVAAQVLSRVLLYPMGGLSSLVGHSGLHGDRAEIATELLWDPDQGTSWWYLALPAPHSSTPLDLLHTLGSAMAVLGAALLLTRIAAVARLLRPVAWVGAMTLTLYSLHLLMLQTGVLEDQPLALYLLCVSVSLAFAVLWRRRHGQGPLEKVVAVVSGRARRAVLGGSAAPVRVPERE